MFLSDFLDMTPEKDKDNKQSGEITCHEKWIRLLCQKLKSVEEVDRQWRIYIYQ